MSPESPRDRAVDTIARHLAARDRTPAADRPDAEIDAVAVLQALWARGWRPTAVQPPPPWMPATGRPARRADVHRLAAEARAALAQTLQETQTDER